MHQGILDTFTILTMWELTNLVNILKQIHISCDQKQYLRVNDSDNAWSWEAAGSCLLGWRTSPLAHQVGSNTFTQFLQTLLKVGFVYQYTSMKGTETVVILYNSS